MNNSSLYLTITTKENNGKLLAFVKKINRSNDVKSALSDPRIICATYCPTRKEALELADQWNLAYMRNGDYFFGDRPAPYPAAVV